MQDSQAGIYPAIILYHINEDNISADGQQPTIYAREEHENDIKILEWHCDDYELDLVYTGYSTPVAALTSPHILDLRTPAAA
jgi:hypothetical protein